MCPSLLLLGRDDTAAWTGFTIWLSILLTWGAPHTVPVSFPFVIAGVVISLGDACVCVHTIPERGLKCLPFLVSMVFPAVFISHHQRSAHLCFHQFSIAVLPDTSPGCLLREVALSSHNGCTCPLFVAVSASWLLRHLLWLEMLVLVD